MSTGIVTRRKSAMHIDNSYGIDVVAANTNLVSKRVLKGEPFITQIVCDEGYSIYEITIKMGNTDITSTAFDPTYNTISIAQVTADVSIDVVALISIPTGYTRVDGIKNPSNAWMNTGYYPNPNTRLELKATMERTGQYLAANKATGMSTTNGSGWAITSNYLSYYVNKGLNNLGISVVGNVGTVVSLVGDYYKKVCIIDGSRTISYAEKTTTDIYPIALFACISSGSVYAPHFSQDQITYYFHIYDYSTNSYVRYYIPCLNDQNVAGFWDAARGVFQGSSNSTAFEAVAAE